MLVILYVMQESEAGVMMNQAIISKPSQETDSEKAFGRLIAHTLKAVETELAKCAFSKSGTHLEGQHIDALAAKLAAEGGFDDFFSALRDAGFSERPKQD